MQGVLLQGESDGDMRILVFMPRSMKFGPSNASSVDLCVRDLIAPSRYREATTIVCCEIETLFPDLSIATYSDTVDASRRRKLAFASQQVSNVSADLIVVTPHQGHLGRTLCNGTPYVIRSQII